MDSRIIHPPVGNQWFSHPPAASDLPGVGGFVTPPSVGGGAYIEYTMNDFRVLTDGTNILVNRGTSYGL